MFLPALIEMFATDPRVVLIHCSSCGADAVTPLFQSQANQHTKYITGYKGHPAQTVAEFNDVQLMLELHANIHVCAHESWVATTFDRLDHLAETMFFLKPQ